MSIAIFLRSWAERIAHSFLYPGFFSCCLFWVFIKWFSLFNGFVLLKKKKKSRQVIVSLGLGCNDSVFYWSSVSDTKGLVYNHLVNIIFLWFIRIWFWFCPFRISATPFCIFSFLRKILWFIIILEQACWMEKGAPYWRVTWWETVGLSPSLSIPMLKSSQVVV